MAIKPILFNTEMVQAIIQGQKTQTRRIIKGIECLNVYRAVPAEDAYETLGKWDFFHGWSENGAMIDAVEEIKAPYSVGDVLWVRETWDKAPESRKNVFHEVYYYKADGDLRPDSWKSNWHPSIHMPKEAARIFLRVKNVQAQTESKISFRALHGEETLIVQLRSTRATRSAFPAESSLGVMKRCSGTAPALPGRLTRFRSLLWIRGLRHE